MSFINDRVYSLTCVIKLIRSCFSLSVWCDDCLKAVSLFMMLMKWWHLLTAAAWGGTCWNRGIVEINWTNHINTLIIMTQLKYLSTEQSINCNESLMMNNIPVDSDDWSVSKTVARVPEEWQWSNIGSDQTQESSAVRGDEGGVWWDLIILFYQQQHT